MAYSGRINYINLAEPVETRIKQSVQYSEIVSNLDTPTDKTVPSTSLLKQISDKVDNASNVNIVTDGTVPTYDDLPPAETNTGKVYVVDGTVYISNGTEWISQGAIKGEKGDKGDKGDGLHFDGSATTVEQLPNTNTNGKTYLVNGKVYVYSEELKTYIDGGSVQGEQGLQGEIGQTGEQGVKGEKGDNGLSAYELAVNNGFVGTQAEFIASLKGDKGDQGLQGEQGIKGDTGERGIQGLQGEKGDIGLTGLTGLKGDKGEKGDVGERGLQGEQGAQGIEGDKGDTGEQGIQGEKGDRGIQGLPGVQGVKGDMGDGFTITKTYKTIIEMNEAFATDSIPVGAFVIISSDEPDTDPDNSKVFVKTETEYRFQSVLRGLKGETGTQGEQGIQGEQGVAGERGIQGIQGAPGVRGLQGKSVTLKGTVADEPALAEIILTNNPQVGDAYWTENGILWIWTDNPALVAEPAFLRSPSLVGKQGIKGDKGDTGQDGLQGDKGDTGETGESIELKGILNSEAELPLSAIIGDTYWVGTKLYTWTKNPKEGVTEGFLASPDLKGAQGIRGEKGDTGEGVTDLGTATLLTQAQTIRESINEVFQSGNNVKKEVVSALLSKDSKLTITENSSWSEINLAINQIKTGITPIGQEKTVSASGNVLEGNFVTLVEQFTHSHGSLSSGLNFSGLKKQSYTYLSEGRVAIAHKNAVGGINVTILTHQNNAIINSGTIQVTNVSPSGDYPEITSINKNLLIVQSKSGSAAPAGRNQIHPISISDNNAMTVRSVYIVDEGVDSGNYNGIIRFSDTEFGAIYRNSANDAVSIKLYTINSTGTSITLGKTSSLLENSAWDASYVVTNETARYTYFTVFGYTKTGANLIGRAWYYDKTLKGIYFVTSTTTFNTNTDSAKNQRPYIFTKKNGTKAIVVFHRGSNSTLDMTYMNISSSNGSASNISTKKVVDISGAGYTSSSGEEKTHSAVEISPGLFYLVYKSSTGTDTVSEKDLSGGFIDFNQDEPILFGQKLIHSQGRWRFPLLLNFGAGKLGLSVQGSDNTNLSFEFINPSILDSVKVSKGNDIVHGIAMTNGNTNDEIKIVIPNP